jgi:methyl-accepting chemotaxis protein
MMSQLAYKIQIGSDTYDTAGQDLLRLHVDMDMEIPADSFTIALRPVSRAATIKNGDSVVIELGYGDALNKILTGFVDNVQSKVNEVLVTGLGGVALLARLRVNQLYENQSAKSIIEDLADRVSIKIKKADEGLTFPTYVVDENKNAYCHIKELARRCGFDLFLTGDGRLIFRKYSAEKAKKFKHGRDVIHAEAQEPGLANITVRILGESPSSIKGSGTAHIIAKEVVEGTAGKGSQVITIEDPTVKDKDSATKAAAAHLEALLTSFQGTFRVMGNSTISLGDTIEIVEMPDKRMNGEFKITKITHEIEKNGGFTTTIGWIKKVPVSPGEPPLIEAAEPSLPKPPSPLEDLLDEAKSELENLKLELLDAVEEGMDALEGILSEIQNTINELIKRADEMLAAAEEVKKAAMETVGEALQKAEELKKELEEQKKEIQKTIDEAKATFDELKKKAQKQINEVASELKKVHAEIEKIVAEGEKKVQDAKKKAEAEKKVKEELEPIEKEIEEKKKQAEEKAKELETKIEDTKKEIDEAEKKVKEQIEPMEKEIEEITKDVEAQIKEYTDLAEKTTREADEQYTKAVGEVNNVKKEIGTKMEDLKKAYNTARNTVQDARKMAGLD